MKRIMQWLFGPKQKFEFSFPILHAGGGKLRDHSVWAEDELQARRIVMLSYDTGVFIIGPARQIGRG